MNLVVSLYMLGAALCVPVSGWVADRYGPRRLFVIAISLFIASSLACAASNSLLQLCLARMLQGAAGAMMVPVGQLILLRWSPREDSDHGNIRALIAHGLAGVKFASAPLARKA